MGHFLSLYKDKYKSGLRLFIVLILYTFATPVVNQMVSYKSDDFFFF